MEERVRFSGPWLRMAVDSGVVICGFSLSLSLQHGVWSMIGFLFIGRFFIVLHFIYLYFWQGLCFSRRVTSYIFHAQIPDLFGFKFDLAGVKTYKLRYNMKWPRA